MPATLDAAALCKMADRGQIAGAIVDGPLAFDNAVSAAAARTKGIVSEVAGAADILVVPDLESGNMLAKQLEYLGGAASAGIVLGARVPIVLTSRADPREARIASCAVALVAARRGAHLAANVGQQRPSARRQACRTRSGDAGAAVMSAAGRPKPLGRLPATAPFRPTGCRSSEPILVLNCGSSSIKFALVRRGSPSRCRASRCGPARSTASAARASPRRSRRGTGRAGARRRGRTRALQPCAPASRRRPRGGCRRRWRTGSCTAAAKYAAPVRVDRAVLAELKGYIPLAPLHQPFALQAIEVLLAEAPELPQVACFDTAFHRTLPQVEQMLPLPYALWERGIRRYGFHGLSYEYMAIALAERHGDAARGRTIVAHLGSGASLCAMQRAAKRGDHDGLLRARRSDDGHALRLTRPRRAAAPDRDRQARRWSSSRICSTTSPDCSACPARRPARSRCSRRKHTSPRARAALELYVRRIVREIGALTAVLGGLDMLAFTAGVGEHSAVLRERICGALDWLGVRIDDAANRADASTISDRRAAYGLRSSRPTRSGSQRRMRSARCAASHWWRAA